MAEELADESGLPASCRELRALEQREGISIPPIERLLLVSDGTVTHLLEALTRERIDVVILQRERADGVLTRRVHLETTSGTRMLWADSTVILRRLPDDLAATLESGDTGIGRALDEANLETRRRIATMEWTDSSTEALPSCIPASAGPLFVRTYQIIHDGNAIMTITEYFPRQRYASSETDDRTRNL